MVSDFVVPLQQNYDNNLAEVFVGVPRAKDTAIYLSRGGY